MMSEMTAEQILGGCPLFSRVQGVSRQGLIGMGVVRRFIKGGRIIQQDQPCPGVYIVGEGLVRIYKLSPSGKEHVLHMTPAGGTLLEVASILDMNCPAFAEALEDSTCLLLPHEPFRRALREDHALCLQLLGGMAMRVRQFVGLLEDIVLRDALSRVANHLLGLSQEQGGDVSLPSFKKHMASHLNLTSETLSRCLRQLTDAGLIESSEGSAIRVLDEGAMREVADGMWPRI